MRVSKWGGGLAERLPKKLFEEMGIAAGDEIELTPVRSSRFAVSKVDPRADFLEKLRTIDWPLPQGYAFDREEANAR